MTAHTFVKTLAFVILFWWVVLLALGEWWWALVFAVMSVGMGFWVDSFERWRG